MGKRKPIYESEMALFHECIRCAQIVLDMADIVRDGDVSSIDQPLVKFRVADDGCSISNTLASWLLVRGSGKQQQIVIWIFDDERVGAPWFPFQTPDDWNESN